MYRYLIRCLYFEHTWHHLLRRASEGTRQCSTSVSLELKMFMLRQHSIVQHIQNSIVDWVEAEASCWGKRWPSKAAIHKTGSDNDNTERLLRGRHHRPRRITDLGWTQLPWGASKPSYSYLSVKKCAKCQFRGDQVIFLWIVLAVL